MADNKSIATRDSYGAALLELASGFDGELTVRENTYLRGASGLYPQIHGRKI